MATYSIYLRNEIDEELKSSAKREGITPIELIKKRISQAVYGEQIRKADRKIDALFCILESIANDVCFLTGVTQTGAAKSTDFAQPWTEAMRRAGNLRTLKIGSACARNRVPLDSVCGIFESDITMDRLAQLERVVRFLLDVAHEWLQRKGKKL